MEEDELISNFLKNDTKVSAPSEVIVSSLQFIGTLNDWCLGRQ